MEDYLNWKNEPSEESPLSHAPTSTINDQDLLDFSGLDQFLPKQEFSPSLKQEEPDDQGNELVKQEDVDNDGLEQYQPQSYHLTPSVSNSYKPPMSSSFSGSVRRSLSKAMSNSRKSSIIKDESSVMSGSGYLKSPRSRKSSIAGTPGSLVGSVNNGSTPNAATSVERKRRDNINDKIQELLMIIPATFFYENEKSTGTKDGKPNKGQILSKSVEYIQYLQNEIDFKNRKEVELIYKLKKLNFDTSNFANTSAEIGLGKIGVGPLNHLQHEEARRKWQLQQQQQQQLQTTNDEFTNDHNNNNESNDYLNF